jgi:hypothetical protein
MLTRISRSRHEDGIRLALGATPAVIGRMWLAEVVLLATAGGLLGLAVARWITRAIVALAPDDVPRVADMAIDTPVALFTFAVVLVVAIVTAAIPLRYAGRASLLEAVAGARSTAGRGPLRVQSTLLVIQIGMAVVLLVGAALVVRSFIALRQIDLGFAPEGVLSVTVQPGTTQRPPNIWLQEFLVQVRALPGVETAGAVYLRPLMLGPIGQAVFRCYEDLGGSGSMFWTRWRIRSAALDCSMGVSPRDACRSSVSSNASMAERRPSAGNAKSRVSATISSAASAADSESVIDHP